MSNGLEHLQERLLREVGWINRDLADQTAAGVRPLVGRKVPERVSPSLKGNYDWRQFSFKQAFVEMISGTLKGGIDILVW